jgi:hypothetical protein
MVFLWFKKKANPIGLAKHWKSQQMLPKPY